MKTEIELAREAGFPERRAFSDLSDLYPRLERFAELVRADERARMAEQPAQQEPVACVEYIPCCTDKTCSKCKAATPAQRTWVGLTDEELDEMFSKTLKGKKLVNWVAQAIEAKLKEKNT